MSDADAGRLAIPSTGVVAVADGRGIHLVSLAADMVYEGMRAVAGPLLGSLGLPR
jgi:hypothetical protein